MEGSEVPVIRSYTGSRFRERNFLINKNSEKTVRIRRNIARGIGWLAKYGFWFALPVPFARMGQIGQCTP